MTSKPVFSTRCFSGMKGYHWHACVEEVLKDGEPTGIGWHTRFYKTRVVSSVLVKGEAEFDYLAHTPEELFDWLVAQTLPEKEPAE